MHCTWPFFCTYKELPLGEKRLQAVSNTFGEARARQPPPETCEGVVEQLVNCTGSREFPIQKWEIRISFEAPL